MDGSYFIDACPRAFDVIINWLRLRRARVDVDGLTDEWDTILPADVHIDRLSLAAKMIGLHPRKTRIGNGIINKHITFDLLSI